MENPFKKDLPIFALCPFTFALLAACAAPRPVLYPNAHLQEVGKDQASVDIAQCEDMAKDAGASPSDGKAGQAAGSTAAGAGIGAAAGAAGGAVVGHAGRGAAIGAVGGATGGLLRGLFRRPQPSHAYTNFVDRCLKERGYDVTGWN
jgi:hypothetical protein